MLKIVRAEDPIQVNQITTVIYGAPGLGKTTLGFSSDNPLLLDFDRGAYRAMGRRDIVAVESWSDTVSITAEDMQPYNTIVVDTVGRLLDFLSDDIIRRNPKMGRGGALTLQGWGALKSEFYAWAKTIRLLGKDIILIAHASEEKKGDDIIERLDVQGGSKGEIYKSADAMGRISIQNGKRILNFSPTDAAFGKNPAGLPPVEIPDISTSPDFFAGVIQSIKNKINELSDEQEKRKNMIADWLSTFDGAKTTDDFNQLIETVQTADASILPIVKGELHKRATNAGFKYEKGNGYVEAAA